MKQVLFGTHNITEDYRVTADQFAYHLQRRSITERGENKGREYWHTIGYYGRIEHLIRALLNYDLMEHIGDLKIAMERIDAIEKHLEGLVELKYEREKSWS